MKAICTGSSGFICSWLVDRLLGSGWGVLGIDNADGGLSIQDASHVPRGFDAIFHLASPVGPVGVLDWTGRLAYEVAETTQIVAGWARENDCPLIFVSTSEVYGSGGEDNEEDVCTFRAMPSARKEYALAKLAAETTLLNTPGLDVRIIRPFNVAGPRQKVDGGFVLPRFVGQALDGKELTVYAPGSQRRAFTHVADIVDGLLACYERGKPGGVYNLGNAANACTIMQLADEVVAMAGSSSEICLVDPRELHGDGYAEAPDKIPNAARAMGELGWMPTRSRVQAIADVIDYERARRS